MEDFVLGVSDIHGRKGNMGNSVNDKQGDASLANNEKYYFGNSIIPYFLNRILTTTLKNIKMAEAKLAWVLWHILGGSSFLLVALPPKYLGLLDINVASIPQPFQAILYIIALLYGVSVVWRSFHKGYHMHLRNREYRHQIKRKYESEKIH